MPVLSDAVSMCKIAQFENPGTYLGFSRRSWKRQWKNKNRPFHMATAPSPNYMEQLMWSELGDYVREILRKERE